MADIKYSFKFGANQKLDFIVKENGWQETGSPEDASLPEWTQLGHKQCSNCPLKTTECKYCPVAVDIKDITERFKEILSYTETKVTVTTEHRMYYRECDVQTGLKSLFGLIMARSGCPILNKLRGLAHSHLPFAGFEDNIRRIAGAYMLKQYYAWVDGKEPDFGLYGINNLFGDLQTVNENLAMRLRTASNKDSNINAVLLFINVTGNDKTIWDHLAELRPRLDQGF